MSEIVNGIPSTTSVLTAVNASAADTTLIKGYTDTEVASILGYVDTEVASIKTETDKLKYLLGTATTDISDPVNIVPEVVANSILSHILTTNGDTVNFDRRTMSLKALSDYLIALDADVEILDHHFHNRQRTYPYLLAGVILTGDGANTMGTIVEVVPTSSDEINTLTITHSCDVAGNITIDLNGVKYTKAIATGNTGAVAAQLRAMTFNTWVITGSGNDVIFTRKGLSTTGVLSNLGTTAVTGTFVKTQTGAGIYAQFDIHSLQVGLTGNQDTYIISLYSGLAGYEELICSRRFTTTSNNAAGGEVPCITPIQAAGTRISASVATIAGGNKTAVVSLSYHWYE